MRNKMEKTPHPTEITLEKAKKTLEIAFADGKRFELPCEYLRVFSPSAEVRGHGPGQETLQVGKEDVNIERIEQVGTYAIQLDFDDGHNSGIYSWDLLYDLGVNYLRYWQDYLDRLAQAGVKRKVATPEAK
jgi:DUF971 family protein